MVDFVFLTTQFFVDHSWCTEIEKKPFRPHVQVEIELNGVRFYIPMRSNINHKHVLWTDRNNNCGLDFSKTVVVTDRKKYVDFVNIPKIRQKEFDALRGKEHIIKTRLMRYIKEYKTAKSMLHIPRNRTLVNFSTLKYFEKYI